ncbi:MAG: glycosyl hydrolase family 5 [Rhodobacteraceae bacterium]|nr:glycosyl hydrolase family 5 [Paracoccaceae bacterium]
MLRRTFLELGAGVLAAATLAGRALAQSAAPAPIGPDHPLQAAWTAWKAAYLDKSGRVVDGPQQSASHSEGQGYGLYLAMSFGDATVFDLIRRWTEKNLAGRRSDALLAWRWLPGGAVKVSDTNNATDGDLFYAWALLRGAEVFGQPDYRKRALAITNDIVAGCVVPHPDGSGRLLLRPGVGGFDATDGVILNPSYYMPRAMRELAVASGRDELRRCAEDGQHLMDQMSATGLVPDWAEVTSGGWQPAVGLSAACGYDAMRVPFFLLWSGASGSATVKRFHQTYRRSEAVVPPTSAVTVFDTATGAVTQTSPDAGFRAIPALIDCALSDQPGSAIPPFTTQQPYYPATLHLLTLVVQVESFPACVPI